MKKALNKTLLSIPLILLSLGCTHTTPEGEYRLIFEDFDYTLVGDFEFNVKGKNNNFQDKPPCPTSGAGGLYYVAITPPVNEDICTYNGELFSLSGINFKSLDAARDYANRIAQEPGVDTIYGTKNK